MVEHVISHNPDQRVLDKAFKLLRDGKLIAFPTDTNWVVTCDPFERKGTDKLYQLKGADRSKHFSLLCDSISRATELAEINDSIFHQIKKKVPGHYTFIFRARKKVIRSMKASKSDHEVGLRFPPGDFVQQFLKGYGGPLLSTNITHELLDLPDDSIDLYSYLIEDSLGHQLGMIIDPGEFEIVGSSTIIDFAQTGEAILVREGSGPWP